MKKTLNKISLVYIAIFLVALIYLNIEVFKQESGLLRLKFLDVGQGDAILIITPNNSRVLIDAGNGYDIKERLAEEIPFYDREIDYAIATHADNDHMGGFDEVLEEYDIDKFIINPTNVADQDYITLIRLLEGQNIPIIEGYANDEFEIDGVRFQILWPYKSDFAEGADLEENDLSVVCMISYKSIDLLAMGDLEMEKEAELMERNSNLVSEILKVSHHGSKSSTSEDFLAQVNTVVSIISAGYKNKFNHPSPEVVDRIKASGSTMLETSVVGTITIKSDGEEFWVE